MMKQILTFFEDSEKMAQKDEYEIPDFEYEVGNEDDKNPDPKGTNKLDISS